MKSRIEMRIQKLESKLGSFDKIAEESGLSIEDIQSAVNNPDILSSKDKTRIKGAICDLCEKEFPGGIEDIDRVAMDKITETIREVFAGGAELGERSRSKIKAGMMRGSTEELEEIIKKMESDPNIKKVQTFALPVPSKFMEAMTLVMFYAKIVEGTNLPWLTVFAPIWIPITLPYMVKAVIQLVENNK